MPQVLVVHESQALRTELARALQAEGFSVTEADTALAAVRAAWEGSFAAALLSEALPGMDGDSLEKHLHGIAPEVVTVKIGREKPARLARRVAEILDGEAAA